MKRNYTIHPELKKDLPYRIWMNRLMAWMTNKYYHLASPWMPKDPELEELKVLGISKDYMPFHMISYRPKSVKEPLPCLIYYHGGGFFLGLSPNVRRRGQQYAKYGQCHVILVDYRLMPKYVYPKAMEDAYSALSWVRKNAKVLRIDSKRIGVGGDSAGGLLASLVAKKNRDEGHRPLCFQLLIYPVTDCRMETASMKRYRRTPMWNACKNEKMWRLYLSKLNKDIDQEPYVSALPLTTCKRLPKAYIEVAQFDCLHDEGVDYAKALQEAGVEATIVETQGTIHGYDNFRRSLLVKSLVRRRICYLRQGFEVGDT